MAGGTLGSRIVERWRTLPRGFSSRYCWPVQSADHLEVHSDSSGMPDEAASFSSASRYNPRVSLTNFIERWSRSSAAERANKDASLLELCEALLVER